jgi:hypothetical protein
VDVGRGLINARIDDQELRVRGLRGNFRNDVVELVAEDNDDRRPIIDGRLNVLLARGWVSAFHQLDLSIPFFPAFSNPTSPSFRNSFTPMG